MMPVIVTVMRMVPGLAGHDVSIAVGVAAAFALAQWRGIRWGSLLQNATSLAKTAAFLGSGLAYAIGGVLVDLMSPRAVFVAASVGVLTASIGGVLLLPRERPATEPPTLPPRG